MALLVPRLSSKGAPRIVYRQEALMKSQDRTTTETNVKKQTKTGILVGFPACVDHVPVPAEITSCPCTAGNFCCASGVCAQNQNACGAATLALSEAAKGEWTGYLENFQWSLDDSIKISIAVAPNETLSGQVVLGKDIPPAPATDPNAPWPPSVDLVTPLLPPYIPGFIYTAQNIRWESQRLRFTIAQYEAWQPWCELQHSYQTGDTFSCIPGSGGVGNAQGCFATNDAGDIIGPVECFKLYPFCGGFGPCSCDAAGCSARTDASHSFDIALRDGIGDGSTDLSGGSIRLTQTSH